MKIQVLVSAVNKKPKNLIRDMHLTGNAIVINQCDKNDYEEIENKDGVVKVYYFNERGIGLSRNSALMRADADIVLFADDDEVLVNDYEQIITDAFNNNKLADMIVFDVIKENCNRKSADISEVKKLNKFNSLRYGAVRFAVKLDSIRKNNISFSLLFGGGAKYGSGEDSIFIYDCLKNKMKVFSSPIKIASVDFTESSWFNGYNDKFFYDKGALFYALYGNKYKIFAMLFLIKHRNDYKINSIKKSYAMMKKGAKGVKNNEKHIYE